MKVIVALFTNPLWLLLFFPLPRDERVTVAHKPKTVDGNYLINWTVKR